MSSVAIKKFVGLKTKMQSIIVSDSSEYKKANGVNKIVVTKINHNEFKDVLSNKRGIQWIELKARIM